MYIQQSLYKMVECKLNSIPRFHLAFPVHNLESAREFYVSILKCKTGRESNSWIDFDLYGHQIVAHLSPDDCSSTSTNIVDNDNILNSNSGTYYKKVILLYIVTIK